MIRIAHVVESFAYGTAKTVTQICGYQDNDCEATIFHGHRQGTELDLIDLGPNVHYERLPGTGPVRHVRNIRFLADRLPGFDLIHAHSSYGGLYAKWLSRRLFGADADRRVLYSPHGFAFLRNDLAPAARGLIRWFERRTSDRCTTLACGPHEASLAADWRGPVRCIANGHEVSSPRPVGELDGTVLGVGRICPQKGFDIFRDVAAACPERAFRWVGEPQRVGDPVPSVPPNLTMTPYLPHDELLALIRSCRVIFLPSRWEGLSRFLIEGICNGKALVTSTFPANLDCLDGDGIDGVGDVAGGKVSDGNGDGVRGEAKMRVRHYPNGFTASDVDGYAAAIRATDDDGRLASMQAASHLHASRHYDIAQIREVWRRTYRDAASGEPVAESSRGDIEPADAARNITAGSSATDQPATL